MSNIFKILADAVVVVTNLEVDNARLRKELESSRQEHLKTQEALRYAIDKLHSTVDELAAQTEATLAAQVGDRLLAALLKILMEHCGETGQSEGAVETLERLVDEAEDTEVSLLLANGRATTLEALAKMLGVHPNFGNNYETLFRRIARLLLTENTHQRESANMVRFSPYDGFSVMTPPSWVFPPMLFPPTGY